MVFVCAFRTCVNSKAKTKEKDCKLHKFPKDKTLYIVYLTRCSVLEWLKNCDRLDLRNMSLDKLINNVRVCGKHFTTKMFMNTHRTRLLPTAVPTEFELTKANSNDPEPSINVDETICVVLLERPIDSVTPLN